MSIDRSLTTAMTALSDARARMMPVSTASRVASALREQLAEGLLPPGSRLPEEAIGDALGVSRNTVREAFVELAGERLVVRHPNRGVFVARMSSEDVRDVYRVRRAIEVAAARGGGSAASVQAVRRAVTEGQQALEAHDWLALGSGNQHFHRAVVALAGSRRLDTLMTQVLVEMRLFFQVATTGGQFHSQFVPDNERVCTLLESADFSGAADALTEYLDRAERELLRHYPKD